MGAIRITRVSRFSRLSRRRSAQNQDTSDTPIPPAVGAGINYAAGFAAAPTRGGRRGVRAEAPM